MRDRHVRVAAEQRRHTGVGDRRGLGHGEPAGPYQTERRLVADDSGEGGGGDLTNAVTCDDVRGRVKGGSGQQTGGDQQRLRHRGVTDRVRVGLGAVVARSSPIASDQAAMRSAAPGRSSQGVRKPGV